jgi:predicted O-methyltransferase YrrM
VKSALHALRHALGLDPAHTQTTAAERDCLRRQAAVARLAAEIGVYEGVSTRAIREAMPADGVLHAVDPFFRGRLGICWGRVVARREIARSRGARVEFVERLSVEAAPLVPDGLDLLFIDADHRYEGLKADWEAWSPKLRAGGFALLHDTRVPPHDPSVAALGSVRFFEEVIRHDPRFELVEQVDSLSVLRCCEAAPARA